MSNIPEYKRIFVQSFRKLRKESCYLTNEELSRRCDMTFGNLKMMLFRLYLNDSIDSTVFARECDYTLAIFQVDVIRQKIPVVIQFGNTGCKYIL